MEFKVEFKVTERGRKNVQYSLNSDLDGKITLYGLFVFARDALVSTAISVLYEEQDKGFDKNPLISVDGYRGKDIRQVNPFGKIQFFSRVADLAPVLIETFDNILDRSPIRTSVYIRSHVVLHNNVAIAFNRTQLVSYLESQDFDEKDTFTFVNITPYARRLERLGVRKDTQRARRVPSRDKKKRARGITIEIPNGVYYLTCRAMQRKYKTQLTIKFNFVPGSALGGLASRGTALAKAKFKTRRGNKPSRTYLYPAIFITAKPEGIR